jgi:hypothetical protein
LATAFFAAAFFAGRALAVVLRPVLVFAAFLRVLERALVVLRRAADLRADLREGAFFAAFFLVFFLDPRTAFLARRKAAEAALRMLVNALPELRFLRLAFLAMMFLLVASLATMAQTAAQRNSRNWP